MRAQGRDFHEAGYLKWEALTVRDVLVKLAQLLGSKGERSSNLERAHTTHLDHVHSI